MKKHLNTLYLTREESYLSLDGETVSIRVQKEKAVRIPLHNLEAIMCFAWDCMATPQLMAKCAEKGICLSFCNPNGRLLCRITGFSHGNVLLRRQQYRLADDAAGALSVARNMVAAKILNSRTLLQRAVRDNAQLAGPLQRPIMHMAAAVHDARRAQDAASLLGVEGHAAELYFSAFSHLSTNPEMRFVKRSRRPPKDAINALLSFVYAILAQDCRSAAEACGLDAAVGMYHKDRPGRASLALDLMEELRSPLGDRMVLSLVNRRQIKLSDFDVDAAGAYSLKDGARRELLKSWQERKQREIHHPFLQDKITIGMIAHIQARLLAQHIRGALDEYPPMIWK